MRLGDATPVCLGTMNGTPIFSWSGKAFISAGPSQLQEVVGQNGKIDIDSLRAQLTYKSPANIIPDPSPRVTWDMSACSTNLARPAWLPEWWPFGMAGTIAVGLAALYMLTRK